MPGEAERLRDLARRQPDLVLPRAGALAEAGDPDVRVVARHALCLAHAERGEVAAARRAGLRALAEARRAGAARRVVEIQLSLAWLDIERGVPGADRLAALWHRLDGEELGRARCLLGLGLAARGQHAAAVAEFTAALPHLRRNRWWLANLLGARGIAAAYLGHLGPAEDDLSRARALWADAAQPLRAASCLHNTGFVALLGGDVLRALSLFDAAARDGLDPARRPEILLDRAEALHLAGLDGEATAALERACALLTAAGRPARLAEARLALARCALRTGRPEPAATAAGQALAAFRSQRRGSWASVASSVLLRAELARGRLSVLRMAGRTAARCERQGWHVAAAELRLDAARTAVVVGHHALARRLLAKLAANGTPGPAPLRVMAWQARALLAELDGDHRRLVRVAGRGLRVLAERMPALSLVEPRTHVTGAVVSLADHALTALLSSRRVDNNAVLRWTERRRVALLCRPPLRPPDDAELAAELSTLRAAVAEAGLTEELDPAARTAVVRQELRVRRRALAISGAGMMGRPPTTRELESALGPATLLSFFVHSGLLYAVALAAGRTRLHRLGSAAEISTHVRQLRFALSHKTTARISPLQPAAIRAAETLTSWLDHRLRPVLSGDAPLVVVPTGALHDLPWAALPSCHGRPLTVAPSTSDWLRGLSTPSGRPGRAVWVEGPGLAHAEREVIALHQRHGGRLLTGKASTVDRVLQAGAGARVLHVASHGTFRADQPLLSHLDLADGPLYAYDLHRLRRPPRLVVLSACEVGAVDVRVGDELLGLTSALLGAGAATLVASVLPVRDDQVPDLMTTLHDELRRGRTPAEALANAQARHGHLGFQCLGAGLSPLGGDHRRPHQRP
ncbi:CHAT domain-containing protein [Streptoalloteichus hindustanus]|uniref:CHAT domain-containing protein n=1 Tax=Streptoalloteichus hindustanus TaxID=2017 RepID=A0A1M4U2U4_STRHI|nr:CHAT domain-containing protein [Streptoalloteichus hindustanus]SHE51048.1 CHAT domain-containing protein [Streptoalloteichus hindustanus]